MLSASSLQKGLSMKTAFVGMLAAMAVSGCGVGVGEQLDEHGNGIATEQSALTATQTVPGLPDSSTNPKPSGQHDPGTVALPQDPIPMFEGKPMPLPGRDPSVPTPFSSKPR